MYLPEPDGGRGRAELGFADIEALVLSLLRCAELFVAEMLQLKFSVLS